MKSDYPTTETLLVAIRAKCLDCCGGSRREVDGCKLKECTLYPYRSVKAIGGGREKRTEIRGQINLFDALTRE